jgi:hypothetical protein
MSSSWILAFESSSATHQSPTLPVKVARLQATTGVSTVGSGGSGSPQIFGLERRERENRTPQILKRRYAYASNNLSLMSLFSLDFVDDLLYVMEVAL